MKFENSNYARLWDSNEGRKILSAILIEVMLITQLSMLAFAAE